MAREKQCDPRKMMELAVKVMQDSIPERRKDGKAIPFVGAVLWKPDGSVDTACRGELRDGDHAEFTLLERKNRDQKLDGSKLFATLEPCAPGARTPPKKSCAERIVWARIKEIWVGITDPDPTVDRKGLTYLQKNGVIVHIFDRDLQEIIFETNKDFIAQALDRAEEETEKPADNTLSSLENASPTGTPDDMSTEALEKYRTTAKMSSVDKVFKHRLIQQGLLKGVNEDVVPTGFGMLLFGKEPRMEMPQAGLLATIHHSSTKEEVEDFDGPMVLIPESLEQWLTNKLPNIIDRSRMRRNVVEPAPFDMVREAVVNALVHRDYEVRTAKCQLTIDADTIVVKSPGAPLPQITLEQLQEFKAPMLSRNPELHHVFARMGMSEERGLGIRTLQNRANELGLPLPKYSFEDPYLVLTIYRTKASATQTLDLKILNKLNEDERAGWEFLSRHTFITTKAYAEHMGYDKRKAQRHFRRFVDLGLLKKFLEGPASEYHVIRP